MPLQRHLIAPFETGLQTDLRPWLIMDDAFQRIKNAYVFRGRVVKRFGGRLTGRGASSAATAPLRSRLRMTIDDIPAMGPLTGTVPGTVFKVGQSFSVDDAVNGTIQLTVFNDTVGPQAMKSTSVFASGTYDVSNGAYSITGTPTSTVYFYPGEPVMGLTLYEQAPINDQPAFAFDTQFAYEYNGSSWERSATMGVPEWHANVTNSDTNFFWATNWQGITADQNVMFVSNYQAAIGTPALTDDPIYSYDGTTWAPYSTAAKKYTFFTTAGDFILTSLIIVCFKNRLFLINTIEQNAAGTANTQYVNRARFSGNASPFLDGTVGPENFGSFLEQNQTGSVGAGFIDAATEESIIGAEFIKDRLMVYFERSTWEIVYTGNDADPFRWQKINTELGSESTFSTVPFDKVVLAIGNVGVHACNGSNVERIDVKIPDEIFSLQSANFAIKRVHGIRDYQNEMVYWTFPSVNLPSFEKFPDSVLVYNYRNNSWALNDDTITCFGYLEQISDLIWSDAIFSWESTTSTWNSAVEQSNARSILCGNQEGFVFILDDDQEVNAPVMQITNITAPVFPTIITIIDHTLKVDDFIKIQYATGSVELNDRILQVQKVIDKDNVDVGFQFFTGTYTGGGYATRVSRIDILSKQWNPYVKDNRNFTLNKIDLCTQRTSGGSFNIDVYASSNTLSLYHQALLSGCSLGSNTVQTFGIGGFESIQQRLWNPVYFQANGEFVQIRIYLDDVLMTVNSITSSAFELEAICLYTQPTSNRMQ